MKALIKSYVSTPKLFICSRRTMEHTTRSSINLYTGALYFYTLIRTLLRVVSTQKIRLRPAELSYWNFLGLWHEKVTRVIRPESLLDLSVTQKVTQLFINEDRNLRPRALQQTHLLKVGVLLSVIHQALACI